MESDIYGNTAFSLAPDLQKPSNPTRYTSDLIYIKKKPSNYTLNTVLPLFRQNLKSIFQSIST